MDLGIRDTAQMCAGRGVSQAMPELTDRTASSLALSVSVTRSVAPLNSMSRGLSTFSAITCSSAVADVLRAYWQYVKEFADSGR